ncbi:hypothetical protein GOC53_00845 [Sinorhizobium medicae]|nr:hypothetical protein [Sinorhizobium medicae]
MKERSVRDHVAKGGKCVPAMSVKHGLRKVFFSGRAVGLTSFGGHHGTPEN